MKIEMLNVGWLTPSAAFWRRGDDAKRDIRFPVPAYLVETGNERILVDTGLHPGAVVDPGLHYDRAEIFDTLRSSSSRTSPNGSTRTRSR